MTPDVNQICGLPKIKSARADAETSSPNCKPQNHAAILHGVNPNSQNPSSNVKNRNIFAVKNDSLSKKNMPFCGLKNLGNTCYMNSCLQCLAYCPNFANYFLTQKPDVKQQSAAESFMNLIRQMRVTDVRSSIHPSDVRNKAIKSCPQFNNYMQHDAQEFMRFYLDSLHDSMNKITEKIPYEEIKDIPMESTVETAQRWWNHYCRRNDSHVKDTFAGQLYSCVECSVCGNTSKAFDPFLDLSLAVPDKPHVKLEDCFNQLVDLETLDGDNKFYCSKCKDHQKSTRFIRIYREPETLMVHLKRFSQDGAKHAKIQSYVNVDDSLDISKYVFQANGRKITYKLKCIVNHIGSLTGGHYTANCEYTGDWYCMNDATVSHIDTFVTNAAYILFFQKQELSQKSSLL